MVVFHAASGAAAGRITGSRLVGAAAGPFLHVVADRVPHEHPRHEVWEYAGGALIMALLVRRHGLTDPATIGAAAAVMPDLEHLLPGSLRRNRKLFHPRPSGLKRSRRRVSVGTQLLFSTLLMLPVLAVNSVTS
jgi:hypothetical protein